MKTYRTCSCCGREFPVQLQSEDELPEDQVLFCPECEPEWDGDEPDDDESTFIGYDDEED